MKKLFVLLALLPSFAFADLDHKKIDIDLNNAYKNALHIFGNDIKKAQSAWLKFRDLDCSAQLPNFGTGGFAADNFDNCISSHNLTRTDQLKKMLNI